MTLNRLEMKKGLKYKAAYVITTFSRIVLLRKSGLSREERAPIKEDLMDKLKDYLDDFRDSLAYYYLLYNN